MEQLIVRFFVENWKRKVISLFAALFVWYFVSYSIQETMTIHNIPVRVINVPKDKTVIGLLGNGYLESRVTLTLTGTKDVVLDLEPGEFEVLIDASTADQDEWVVQLTKKNLVTLNPDVDLVNHITALKHTDFIVKLSKMVVEKVPINIRPPYGSAPEGYEFLDIWPQGLLQNISGPSEEIDKLKLKGLKLLFNLDDITKDDLDAIAQKQNDMLVDEISFIVPKNWKRVAIPYHRFASEEINDPDAATLRIDFLKKKLLPLAKDIPIEVYYPTKNSDTVNPMTYSLALTEEIHETNGLTVFSYPLYVRDVSRTFLNIVRDYVKIVIVATPKGERDKLMWTVQVINPRELEETYVNKVMATQEDLKNEGPRPKRLRETLLKKRFREYLHRLTLYTALEEKLNLTATLDGGKVIVKTSLPN